MAAFIYKNISDRDLSIIGHGLVPAGGTIESDEEIVNANLQAVEAKEVKQTNTKERSNVRSQR